MDWKIFKASLQNPVPSAELSPLLEALWHDARGDWDRAHALAQEGDDADSAWVHAYLHRKEGDLANAGYWYRRAGRSHPGTSLQDEWEQIARALLAKQAAPDDDR